jgi:hypothetical protein
MLAQMTQRLFRLTSFAEAIQTILDDVIALHGAEYGDMQLPIGDELVIVAQRGLSADFLKTFRRVKKGDGCACGRALRLRQAVIVPDVQNDPEFVNFVPDANKAPDDEPERTAVYWEAEFDANGASDDEATKKIYDILVAFELSKHPTAITLNSHHRRCFIEQR